MSRGLLPRRQRGGGRPRPRRRRPPRPLGRRQPGRAPNGEERGLDHLGADGRPSGRVPVVEGSVYALAARGGMLHLGGAFSRVGGRDRPGLATVRSGDGSVTAFDPRPAGGGRMALGALPRGRLIAGGSFGGMEFRATSGLARFGR